MGRAERRKGHDFEREIARRFRDIFPESKRGFQTRGGSSEQPDVYAGPFWVECKRQKQPNIRAAFRQAEEGAGRSHWPVAITKADRQPALVTMELDDFLDLLAEWVERGND